MYSNDGDILNGHDDGKDVSNKAEVDAREQSASTAPFVAVHSAPRTVIRAAESALWRIVRASGISGAWQTGAARQQCETS
jgi:hypothetical protein